MKKKRIFAFALSLVLAAGAFAQGAASLGESEVSAEAAMTQEAASKAYLEWLDSSKADDYKKFKLIDLDSDGVSELIGISGNEDLYGEVYEYVILTYNGSKIVKKSFYSGWASAGGYRGDTSILPGKGKILERSLLTGSGEGADVVYTLKNGKFKKTATGTSYNYGRSYKWKGKSVSADTYKKNLDKVFPVSKGKSLWGDLSYQSKNKIKNKLK